MEIQIAESYTSFSCFVDGASINLGSADVKSTVERDGSKLAGRVHLDEPHDVFDKPFRFDVKVDVEVAAGETVAGEPLAGGLAVDEQYPDLVVPTGCSHVIQGGSPYMKSLQASVDADLADVLTFYRAALSDTGWQENVDATSEAEKSATMAFTGDEGSLSLELGRRRGETMITVTLRQEDLAKEHGIVPAKGKAMLILGNATDAAVQVMVDGKAHKLAAGQGGRDPAEAVKVPIEPGEHTAEVPGSAAEKFEVPIDATWGVIVIPSGGVYSDRVY
jgi:hypothetical protein